MSQTQSKILKRLRFIENDLALSTQAVVLHTRASNRLRAGGGRAPGHVRGKTRVGNVP